MFLRFLLYGCLFVPVLTQAQTALSLAECEQRFQAHNFSLLAQHYQIDEARGLLLQSRLWENPVLSTEWNAAAPGTGKLFNVNSNGQKAASIQQLLYLGGKKRKEIAVAAANVQLSELEFIELLRNLRYELRGNFFALYFDQARLVSVTQQLTGLDSLVNAYQVQVDKGNIALKELVRLQNTQLVLHGDQLELAARVHEEGSVLRLLVASDTAIIPQPTVAELEKYKAPVSLNIDQLANKARESRGSWLLAEKRVEAADAEIRWQRALAVPDLTAGFAYDQNGGAFRNQINFVVGLPLPLWNRNQGGIKASQARYQQARLNKAGESLTLEVEISTALQNYQSARVTFSATSMNQEEKLQQVYAGIYKNFQLRNITLLEFTDFMESFHESQMQRTEIIKRFFRACEDINYVTGSSIF